jgi:hypothetical protein
MEMNPDFGTNEAAMITREICVLTGSDLTNRLAGNTVWGDYGQMFKFVTLMHADGRMEGKNNAGAHNFGEWIIDSAANTISVRWDAGWDATTTRAYQVNGSLVLFDVSDGNWRTTFTKISDGHRKI